MFYTLFTQPVLNLLAFFVWLAPGHDLGVAIILLTGTLRVVLWPLQAFSTRSQEAMARLQPQLDAIKQKFPNAKDQQLEAMLALYRAEHVNPGLMMLGNVAVLAVQLPILIAFFRLFARDIAQTLAAGLYSFVPHSGEVSTFFLGAIDLARPNIVMAALAGGVQFFQMRLAAKKTSAAAGQSSFGALFQKQSQFLFPILTVVISVRLPAALPLYWFVFTLVGVAEESWRMSRQKKRLAALPR